MSDHLPECKALDPMPEATRMFYSTSRQWFWEHGCICDRLRACEQRALDAARAAVEREWTEDPSWDGTNWNNALTVAMDAIDALREEQK